MSVKSLLYRACSIVAVPPVLLGVAAGAGLLHLGQSFFTTFGYSLPVLVPTILVAGAVIQLLPQLIKQLAFRKEPAEALQPEPFPYQWLLTALALVAWTIVSPLLLKLTTVPLGWMPINPSLRLVVLPLYVGTTACLLLGTSLILTGLLPAFLTRRQFHHLSQINRIGDSGNADGSSTADQSNILFSLVQKNQQLFFTGVVLGTFLQTLWLAPMWGSWKGFAISAVAVSSLLSIQIWFPLPWLTHVPDKRPVVDTNRTANQASRALEASCLCLMAAGWGVLLVLFGKMAFHLFPSFSFLTTARWPALLGGLLAGAVITRWRGNKNAKTENVWANTGLATVAVAALSLLCFDLGMEWTLRANATVSNVGLLVLFRLAIIALPVFVIGVCWGRLASLKAGQSTNVKAILLPVQFALPFVLGMVSIHLLQSLFPATDLTIPVLMGTATAIGVISLLPALRSAHVQSGRMLLRFALPAAGLLVAASFWNSYAPATADRLLFSGDVFVARNQDYPRPLLTQLDDGRLLTTVEGEQGTYSVWKQRGQQFLIRKNGLPHGLISANPTLCPDYSAEVLPVLFPLVLHQRAEKILLLGAGSSVPLLTCLDFPLQKIVSVEGDPGLTYLLKNEIWNRLNLQPLTDDRVEWVEMEPALAVASRSDKFDVVVSQPGPTSVVSASPYTTVEHFQNVSDRLTVDGIFCLRFQLADYGAEPLKMVVKSLRSVFSHVTAIEMAGGEMAVLSTQSQLGLDRPGLMARIKRPQSQQILSQLGWDWTIPLNLALYEGDVLEKMASDPNVPTNNAGNNLFVNRLPIEVMRWTSGEQTKRQELAAALGGQPGRMLNWKNIDGQSPALLRRLAEVTAQREMIVKHTDQKYSYRKALRQQLTSERESGIRQVSGEEPKMHPQDRWRKQYLESLGEIARNPNPSPAEIEKINIYETPYDPLISYFLHDEVARLYERSEPRDVVAELDHRLHLAYFTHGQDQSIRNIVSAIHLLADHPDKFPNATQRYDNINALLQVLRTRWELRVNSNPADDRVVLNDIEKSISAIEAAFDAMEELALQVELPADAWPARKQVIERSLLRPLRTYRNQVFPHHLKREQERREKEKYADE